MFPYFVYPNLMPWNITLTLIYYPLIFMALPRLGRSRWWLVVALLLDFVASMLNSGLSNNPHFFLLYPASCVVVVGLLAFASWLHPAQVAQLRAQARLQRLQSLQKNISTEIDSLKKS